MTIIKELRGLLEKVTKGDWVHYDDTDAAGKTDRHEIVAIGKTVARIYMSVALEDAANARLIVLSHNALAALLDCADALEKMVDRWEPDTSGTDRVMWENATEALAKLRGTP